MTMDSSTDQAVISHHKKPLHSKRSFGKYPAVDSPAYDASEEDNDPLTDDAASAVSVPVSRNTTSTTTNNISRGLKPPSRVRHQLASSVVSDDDGVDSPTYDGDIESSTTAGPDAHSSPKSSSGPSHHHHHHHHSSTSTLTSPISAVFPHTLAPTEEHHSQHDPSNTSPRSLNSESAPIFISPPVNAAAVPLRVPQEPAPVPEAQTQFNPASLTTEDIHAFVRKAIDGEPSRTYRINEPPADRPVRIYADGVYDLFHFGHALQLRQAKMSFPSVYLLVGVCSDELVKEHKARSVMNHAERCEAARHCRWVDEVVPDAPWVIDAEFVDKWEIDYVAHDEDPYAAEGHNDVYSFVKSQGKFIPTRRTPGVSTSELLERIVSGYRKRDFDKKLEKMGHAELKAEGSDYEDRSSRVGSASTSRSISP